MRDYYRIKGLERPSWIDAATRYYSMLFYAGRELHEQWSRTNIPKETIEWLSSLDHSLVSDDLPLELREGARECVAVLSEMYHTLIEGKDRYFINQWTLSREGRKKMREYLNILPTVRNIMPPKTEFTNVPDHLIFSKDSFWGLNERVPRCMSTNCRSKVWKTIGQGGIVGIIMLDIPLYERDRYKI